MTSHGTDTRQKICCDSELHVPYRMHLQVLNASPTIDRAVEQFTAARLPDAHALHQLDLNAKVSRGTEFLGQILGFRV